MDDDQGDGHPAAEAPGSASATYRTRRSYARPAALVVAGVALVTAGGFTAANLLTGPAPTGRVLATATDRPSTFPSQKGSQSPAPTQPVTAPTSPATTAPARTTGSTGAGGGGLTTPAPARLPSAAAPSACTGDAGSCPDGRPGWAGAFGSCRNGVAGDVPAATAEGRLFGGVTATFSLPGDSVRAGQTLAGVMTLHNARSDRVSFVLTPGSGDPALVYGPHGGAVHTNDAISSEQVELGPGQSLALDLPVATTSCADTFDQPEPALPAGRYAAGHTFDFREAHVVTDQASPEPSATTSSSPAATASPAAGSDPSTEPVPTDGSVAVRLAFTIT